jgi:nitrous oxidase accessory protein NosD
MEYVPGASLAAILLEQGAIPPTLAADMIYQAALGLQHAHDKALVHRDLKPANLLLTHAQPLAKSRPRAAKDAERPAPELTISYVEPAAVSKGIVKILDLGLARFLQDQLGDSQLTKEGMGVGTPDYMAPEQFRDALHADVRTDIYGLGCTLYQLISGTVPFPGSSFSEKADAHWKKEPIPLEERCPEVPAGLAFVVSKMMAKHPADRFQTAAEVAEALAPYVAGASHSMLLLRQTMRFHAGQLTMRAPNRRKLLLAWAGWVLAAACFAGLFILAWPSMFTGRSGGSQEDTQSTGPGTQASEGGLPKVVTIENGLTVAKDGTGQYTTISEALGVMTRPGMTIRVLDSATYDEHLVLLNPDRQKGVTIEATAGAGIHFSQGTHFGIYIQGVPGVTIRGFRLQGGKSTTHLVLVGGACPGVRLLDLECSSTGSVLAVAISLEGLKCVKEDPPVLVQGCRITGFVNGIRVSGIDNQGKPMPCRGALIRGNKVSHCGSGIWIAGQVGRMQVVGNQVWGSSDGDIDLHQLLENSSEILIANNSLHSDSRCLQINEPSGNITALEIRDNLVLAGRSMDAVLVSKERNLAGCRMEGNWRQVRPPEQLDAEWKEWIPPGTDKIVDRVALLSSDPLDPNFLRPAKDSPLAKAGAGGDLPVYVGAVPPEGVEPWDWQKTWESRYPRMLLTVSKDPKDGGDFRTITEALAKVTRSGQTIRILDNAVYRENVSLRSRERHEGLTLESPRGATLEFPPENKVGLLITNVPHVTVRGLHFHAKTAGTICVGVGGLCPGTLLVDLTCSSNQGANTVGLLLDAINPTPGEEPMRVLHCTFTRLNNGIELIGLNFATKAVTPSRRVWIRENRFEECISGIWGQGQINDIQIVGNQILNFSEAGIRLASIADGSNRILIANNTVKGVRHCIDITEPAVRVEEVEIRNNITIAELSPDMRRNQTSLPATWLIANNWRRGRRPAKESEEARQLLDSPRDTFVDQLPLESLTSSQANFLRPAKDSPLAKGGAGGDLPNYVGAVPPEGVEPWDWQKTWDARARKLGQQGGKTGKD